MDKPFAKVRILDLSRMLSAPYSSHLMRLLGAEVVKVEDPDGGDPYRYMTGDKELAEAGLSAGFMGLNPGKRSLTLDLKRPEARPVFERLIAGADILLENFRPGTMARLGFGYDAAARINPRLIYCSLSGFGQEGPSSQEPAYDGRVQAMSGLVDMTGHPDGMPVRAGLPVADAGSGLMGAFALASALYQRTHTGRGQYVDVAMLDTVLSLMNLRICDYLVSGIAPKRIGNMAPIMNPCSDIFPTADGAIQISANTDAEYATLMEVIGRPDLTADPRFDEFAKRQANAADLRALIDEALAGADAAEWDRRLGAAGISSTPVTSLPQTLADPQVAVRRMVLPLPPVPGLDRTAVTTNAGFLLADGGPDIDAPPPRLGADTDAILAEIGYDDAEIAALRDAGAI